jgi:hypothetical protein
MTFKYTDLGPGDLAVEPDYPDSQPQDLDTRVAKVWDYLVNHSTNTDAAILDLLNGANISHIPWTPVMHELADAVNYVLTQEEQ